MTDFSYVPIDSFLARLDGVKRTGQGKWIAKSPTRNERTASLSIRLTDDGRVLLHDFGGDEAADILAALGLNWVQLIPPHLRRKDAHAKPERQGFPCFDALRALSLDCIVVQIAANRVLDGLPLADTDLAHLHATSRRIDAALLAVGVRS
ncbi:MAG: hypothetical protein PF483_05720 [Halothiobacillus sp.]|jgi:hypothetical protein|nr:hypothetical protein [Halothiobacillus sp.]